MSTYLSCSCHHFLYFSYCSRYFPPFPSLCHLAFIYSALGTAALLFPLNPPSLHPAPSFFFSCVPFEWAEWAENTQESWVHFFPLGCPLARKSPMGTCDIPAIGCCCRLVLPLLILWGLRWLERKPN
ncbi:hypothetical protein BKA57DRAFT_464566 [Linnemannia elongata]|nr:hypothetical protein BKA57DRAFT_464566 [Linnemannia elongata]